MLRDYLVRLSLLATLLGSPVLTSGAGTKFALAFSTLYGGSQFERAQGVAVDRQGYIYICGNTASSDLPTTPGVFQRTYHGDNGNGSSGDGYVAKFTPDGSRLVWATYLGGSNGDRAYNLVVDDSNYVYVTVWTASADFPVTPGAFDTTHNSPGVMDVAYVKLKPDASGLVYSTFVGGAGTEQARGSIYVNAQGELYSSGWTDSTNFPTTPGAFQSQLRGGADAYVIKLSADGSQLLVSTLFGGSADDHGYTRVAVHSDGSIYFAGTTRSRDLPTTPNAFQRAYGGDLNALAWHGDAFVARFKPDGTGLIYATYLGGSSGEEASVNNSFCVDAAGRAIVLGNTTSTNFPVTAGAFQPTNHGGQFGDGFVAVLSQDGSQLVFSTLIGGSGNEESSGLAIDAAGRVYFSGNTTSSDYPVTPDAPQKVYKGGASNTDAFLSVLTSDLTRLIFSTYLGGSGTVGGFGDRGRAVVVDAQGGVIVTGDSNSPDFPTTAGAYQRVYRGGVDAFVMKFTNAVPIAPKMSILSVTNGACEVGLDGRIGETYRLESSTDLVSWVGVMTNTLTKDSVSYVEATGVQGQIRFYRGAH